MDTCAYNFTQTARLIRSSGKELRNKHGQNLLHITASVSTRRSTLRNLRKVEINWFASLSPQVSYQPAATRLRYLTYYTTADIQLRLQRYHRSQKGSFLLVRSSVCYLRLARATSKIKNVSRRVSSRLVRSTPCFLYDKYSRIKSARRATESLLRAGVLTLLWAGSPRSYSMVCYFLIVDVEVLLHSTAIARPKTIRIVETTYCYVFANLCFINRISLNLVPSKGKPQRNSA